MIYYFYSNKSNQNSKNILIKIKENEEMLLKLKNEENNIKVMNIESISSIKEFPFIKLEIINKENNPYFTPLNIILHSLLQIDLLINYFFRKEIKKLYESQEELISYSINRNKDLALTTNFQNIIYNYWLPKNDSLILDSTNIINIFTNLSKNDIDKEDIKLLPQKIIIAFIQILHEELNNLNEKINKKKFINNEKMIINPFNKEMVLNSFINDFKINYHSIISDHFFGIYENIYECMKCKELEKEGKIHSHKSFKYEIFNHLEFNIEEIALYKILRNQNNSLKTIDIKDCIDSINLLSNKIPKNIEELVYCPNCNMKVNPINFKQIFSFPRILLITLYYGNMNVKNSKFFLNYEEKINIKNNIYSLLSVFGKIKDGYILANKNPIDNKWYLYEKLKFIENIELEIIKNPLFRPLYLIYKLTNSNLSINDNPIISLNKEDDLINLYFCCMEFSTKYKLVVSKKLQFIHIIHKLLNNYPELESRKISAYVCEGKTLNLLETVSENKLKDNCSILMINK